MPIHGATDGRPGDAEPGAPDAEAGDVALADAVKMLGGATRARGAATARSHRADFAGGVGVDAAARAWCAACARDPRPLVERRARRCGGVGEAADAARRLRRGAAAPAASISAGARSRASTASIPARGRADRRPLGRSRLRVGRRGLARTGRQLAASRPRRAARAAPSFEAEAAARAARLACEDCSRRAGRERRP